MVVIYFSISSLIFLSCSTLCYIASYYPTNYPICCCTYIDDSIFCKLKIWNNCQRFIKFSNYCRSKSNTLHNSFYNIFNDNPVPNFKSFFHQILKFLKLKFLNKSCAPKATAIPNKPNPAIIGPIFMPHNSNTAAAPKIIISIFSALSIQPIQFSC